MAPSFRAVRRNTDFTKFPKIESPTLYDPQNEKDSCGVGLVAQLKKKPSRQIVLDANEMLVRMSHRGGCGCEVNSGDGAGILVGMPHSYYRRVMQEECKVTLGPMNSYGTGIVFLPKTEKGAEAAAEIFESEARSLGMKVLGWRDVKTDNSSLGETSIGTEPQMRQVFIENTKEIPYNDFDRELFMLRKLVEQDAVAHEDLLESMYICSLSSQTVT